MHRFFYLVIYCAQIFKSLETTDLEYQDDQLNVTQKIPHTGFFYKLFFYCAKIKFTFQVKTEAMNASQIYFILSE